MKVREKIAAVPKTLRYQGKVLTLSEELSDVQFFGSPNSPMAMYRVVFVDENNRPCFMSWIGKKTAPIDWARIEAENTAPHEFTPDESDTPRAISMFKSWERRKQAQFKAILDERK